MRNNVFDFKFSINKHSKLCYLRLSRNANFFKKKKNIICMWVFVCMYMCVYVYVLARTIFIALPFSKIWSKTLWSVSISPRVRLFIGTKLENYYAIIMKEFEYFPIIINAKRKINSILNEKVRMPCIKLNTLFLVSIFFLPSIVCSFIIFFSLNSQIRIIASCFHN